MTDPTPPTDGQIAPLPAAETVAAPAAEPPVPGVYRDTDLVYVDPDTKAVIGPVEWSRAGNPKSRAVPRVESEPRAERAPRAPKGEKGDKPDKERHRGRKYYPWGTYKAMKGAFKLEGKKKTEANKTLDEILPKALNEPFWD